MKAANVPPAFVIIQRINLGLIAVLGAARAAAANWRRHRRGAVALDAGAAVDADGPAEAAWLAERHPA